MQSKFIQLIILFSIFGFFEFLYPVFSEKSFKGRIRNIIYGSIFLIVGGTLSAWVFVNVPFQPHFVKTQSIIHSVGLMILYLFVYDFVFYWYHRAEHHFSFLWPIHELHHSEEELNATTSHRTYWLEQPLQTLLIFYPVFYLIGYNHTSLLMLSVVSSVLLAFTHANLRLSLGWLTPVICGPQVHRIHHSTEPNHYTKNYAQFFPIIDIVFGTFYWPKPDEYPPTGTENLKSNQNYIEVLMRPFSYWIKRIKSLIVDGF